VFARLRKWLRKFRDPQSVKRVRLHTAQEYEQALNNEPREYVYVTAMDERVCPWCGPLEGSVYNEQDIPVLFRHAQRTSPNTYRVNMHRKYLFLLSECRCELHAKEQYKKAQSYDQGKISQIRGKFMTNKRTKDPSVYWTEERLAKLNGKLDNFDDKAGQLSANELLRGAYAARSPGAASRFSMRAMANALIGGGIATMLAPIVFYAIIPLVQAYLEWYAKMLVFNQQKQIEARKAEEYARMYRSINST
jgi:hypothetical protein